MDESHVPPSAYFNIFRVSLTKEQQLALTHLLPRAFSLQPYKCTRSLDEESLRSEPLKPPKKKKELKDPDYSVPYVNKLKEAPVAKVDSTQAIPGGEPFLECYLILKRLKKSMFAWPFKTPVDPKALGIPEYLNVVQEPIDLKTMEDTLRREGYAHPAEFHRDVYKMLMNSYKFNQKNSEVFSNTVEFEEEYLRHCRDARDGKLLAAERKKAEGPEEETPTLSKDKPQSSVEQHRPRPYNKKPKPEKVEEGVTMKEVKVEREVKAEREARAEREAKEERMKVKVEEEVQQPLPSFSQLFDDFGKMKQEEVVDFSEAYEPKEKSQPAREEQDQSVSNEAVKKVKDGRGRGERKPREKERGEGPQSLKEIKELKEVTQVENEKNVMMVSIQRRLSDLLRRLNEFQFNKPKQRPLARPDGDHPNFNNFTNITTSEKKKLAERISLLPSHELKYVIEICYRNRPRTRDEDVFEIDLDKTDPKTLKELSNFVAMRTKQAKRGPKAKHDHPKVTPSQAAVEEHEGLEEPDDEADPFEAELEGENEPEEGEGEEGEESRRSELGELVLEHPGDDINSHILEPNFNFSVGELLEIDYNGRNSDDYHPDEENYHF